MNSMSSPDADGPTDVWFGGRSILEEDNEYIRARLFTAAFFSLEFSVTGE